MRYRIIERTWENGRLIDERLVAQVDSFAEATALARKLSGERVRLNNSDVTVSIEADSADFAGTSRSGAATA
ncbi:MAG: hypothetical protein HUU22_10185 [Phycisphaerae bacterium]|nr:hypothetical protein [Phycisphaerae bacterium]NUQ46391.1 hypothetical protein [Phycisphaerae bacterium]